MHKSLVRGEGASVLVWVWKASSILIYKTSNPCCLASEKYYILVFFLSFFLWPFVLLGSFKDWHQDKGASPEAPTRNQKDPSVGDRGRHPSKLALTLKMDQHWKGNSTDVFWEGLTLITAITSNEKKIVLTLSKRFFFSSLLLLFRWCFFFLFHYVVYYYVLVLDVNLMSLKFSQLLDK